MRIHSEQVKHLRAQRCWSQEQLAAACGLNLRTIQRIENQGTGSLESVKALASVFNVHADDLITRGTPPPRPVQFEIVKTCFLRYVDFAGTAGRPEYWWFFMFVLLATAAGAVVHRILGGLVFLVILMPLLAVGARRLRDGGHRGWWQLLFLVPFGCLVVFWLLAEAGKESNPSSESA